MSKVDVDALIEGFFNNSLTNDEYVQLYEVLKNKEKRKTSKQDAKEEDVPLDELGNKSATALISNVALGELGATIVLHNGLCLNFIKDGTMLVMYDNKSVEFEAGTNITLPPEVLQEVHRHICSLHIRDKKLLETGINQVEEKIRYISNGNKKAFVAGMICGKRG